MLRYILLGIQLGFAVAQVGLYNCPSPWEDFKNKCIKFELVQETLLTARQKCEVDGAQLIGISTNAEATFVSEWLQENSPVSLQWYTSGIKKTTASNNPEDQDIVFYWVGNNGEEIEVKGAQYWLTPEERTKEGDRIIYKFSGAIWGWALVDDDDTPRAYICEIPKTETYRILESERGFDYGLPLIDPELLEHGPKFVLDPVDIIYEATKDNPIKFVEFRCEADADPFAEYNWYRRRQQILDMLDPLLEEKLTITNGRLIIHEPEDSIDNGDYSCRAENQYGAVLSSAATLRFGYLNDFPDTARDAVEVDAHKGIGMDCDPPKHGYSSLSYSWYKDAYTNFIFSDRKPHIFISRDGKLYFSTATKDDQGEYVCVVAVPGIKTGKHSMPIRLAVRESSGNIYEPEMVNGFPKIFPSSPLRGDDIFLECVAWGSLPLDYTWEKVDGTIPAHAQFLDSQRVLHIPNVQIEHSGQYKCSVTRRNGQSASQIIPMEIRAFPYFPISLRNQHVDKGADLTWRCYGKGVPEVDYEWFRNAEPLDIEGMVPEDSARFEINGNILTIREVKANDEGMYQCRISNGLGSRFSSGQLRTISFKPSFDKYPLPPNQYATLGSQTTIICQPESAPPSEKFWFKNGRPLNAGTEETSRVRQLLNGNLHISKVKSDDKGSYMCKASNTLGEAESTGNLTILTSTTITYMPTNNQRTRVNTTAFLHCDATFNPALDLTYDWWHNNYHIEFERLRVGAGNVAYFELDPHYRRGTGINRGGLYIYDVQQWHAGDYFCVVKTSSDEQSSKSLLQVVGPPSPPAGVTGENIGSHSIDLSWWPGSDNGATAQYYSVEGFNIQEGVWRSMKTNIKAATDTKLQVHDTVEGLSPGSQYRFRVSAVNAYGEGDPSDRSEQIYTTDQAPPITAPMGLRGGGGKVGELIMEWDPLPPEEHNGEGVKYKLFWKQSILDDDAKWDTPLKKDELDDLLLGAKVDRFVELVGPELFYRSFDIKIQAINEAGVGPESEIATIYSAEGMPVEVARDVKAVYFNSTAITVHYTPVENTIAAMRGVLKGYRINYWKTETETEFMAQFNTVEGQSSEGRIIGLFPNTFYTVNVQAYNTAGLTAVSEDYTTRTLRWAPKEAPQEVKIFINGRDEIEVEWRGVSTTIEEEPLEGYAVRLWRRGENIYVAEDFDAGKKARRVIRDLEENVMYELRVYAYSRGGVGLQSSPTMEFILGDNCQIVEDSPDKEYIYKCGASFLQWSSILLVSVCISIKNIWHHL